MREIASCILIEPSFRLCLVFCACLMCMLSSPREDVNICFVNVYKYKLPHIIEISRMLFLENVPQIYWSFPLHIIKLEGSYKLMLSHVRLKIVTKFRFLQTLQ